MKYLSVCSGIEAATQAWASLGWQCAGVSEIEPFPRAVLEQRLGAVAVDDNHRHAPQSNILPLFGDFTKIEAHHVGPIDLLVGGTPCQSFSIAGKRLGLDDPRGNLTLEFLALARRLRPRWIVWENVPGVLSHDDGRTMGTFLRLVGECGFRWAYRVLDAQYCRVGRFGRAVPQRRRRVFLVGYSGAAGPNPAAVLFDRESLRGNPAPRRQAGEGVAADVAPSLVSSGRGVGRTGETRGQDPVIACYGGGNTAGPIDIATAQTAQTAHGTRLDFDSETFVAHALRGDGFDASEDGTGRGTPIVPVQQPYSIMPMNSGKDYKARETDVSQPIMASGPGGNQGGDFVTVTQAICFSAKDSGNDAAIEVSPTLRSGGHAGSHANAGVMPAVAFQSSQSGVRIDDVHATLDSNNGSRRHNGVISSWGVRRLTPTECERLQGFPDGFTQIEWRGKPAENCPDGPRYKALGNSMAVNAMAWIGERIAAVEAIQQTKSEAA